MKTIQETLDRLWRDIARQELLEVFEDSGIAVFELAIRFLPTILPPIFGKLLKWGLLETTIREVASFSNLGLALL